MVLLFLYILIFHFIKKELKLNTKSETKIFLICTLVSCLLAIPYRMYLIAQGYEYGLANFDMQLYTTMAEQIKDLGIRESFTAMANNWTFSQINPIQIWGYRFYVFFLKYSIYKWTFLPPVLSIYLVSIWQLLLAAYSILMVYNSIQEEHIRYKNLSLFLMLIAPPIWYGCVRLLRETYMLYCMAGMICTLCRHERHWELKLLLYAVALTIFRPYYTVAMLPLLLLLHGREKLALFMESAIFIVLTAICVLQRVGLYNIVAVILSPNFYNQTKGFWQGPFDVLEVSGQIQFINFIGSVWNIVVVTFAVGSLIITKKLNLKNWCAFGVILDICMIYAIAYGGTTELRHKMFFVVPLVIMLNAGEFGLSQNVCGKGSGISKKAFMISFCVAILLIISIMVLGLVS